MSSAVSKLQSKPMSRTREFSGIAARMSAAGTAPLTFSSRRVVMLLYPGSVKSVMPVWFRMVRLVMVSGRCSTFKMPPLGSVQPVMAVPSK